MKKLIYSLLITVLILLFAFPSWAEVVYVQGYYRQKEVEGSGTLDVELDFQSNVTAGNALFVVIRHDKENIVSSCTHDGQTFNLDETEGPNDADESISILSLANANGGTTRVTCTVSGDYQAQRMLAYEFSGLGISFTKDVSAGNYDSGLASVGPLSVNAEDAFLLFGAASDGDNYRDFGSYDFPTGDNGFQVIDIWQYFSSITCPDKVLGAYRVVSSSGSYTGALTQPSALYHAALVAYDINLEVDELVSVFGTLSGTIN